MHRPSWVTHSRTRTEDKAWRARAIPSNTAPNKRSLSFHASRHTRVLFSPAKISQAPWPTRAPKWEPPRCIATLSVLKKRASSARTSIEGTSSICYRFLPDAPEDVYFFLKCEECGNLSPIDCGELQKLYEHVIEHHHVRINPTKTVLYGLCEACLAKRGE